MSSHLMLCVVVLLLYFSSVSSDSISIVLRCDRNNEYYECGSACQNTCATLGVPCKVFTYRCVDNCFCMPGYARDDCGKCIPEWECINHKGTCSGQNEEYLCGIACQNTCARLGKPCPIKSKKCDFGCFCKKGFARDAFGVCIREEECPSGRCEGLHEVSYCNYYNCQENCTTIGTCNITEPCVEDCFCETGYIRGDNGDCIPQWQCYHHI